MPVPPSRLHFTLPAWVNDFARTLPVPNSDAERMEVAIHLARRNVQEGTGGPFGAAVFDGRTGHILALGVNLVEASHCSAAHAEMIALVLAQTAAGGPRLDSVAAILATSAQPCSMCYGALAWSGIHRLLIGASRQDVENLLGFDEGPIPEDWQKQLEVRGIEVTTGICRQEAVTALRQYRLDGGTLY